MQLYVTVYEVEMGLFQKTERAILPGLFQAPRSRSRKLLKRMRKTHRGWAERRPRPLFQITRDLFSLDLVFATSLIWFTVREPGQAKCLQIGLYTSNHNKRDFTRVYFILLSSSALEKAGPTYLSKRYSGKRTERKYYPFEYFMYLICICTVRNPNPQLL